MRGGETIEMPQLELDYIMIQVINALFYASILFLVSSGLSLAYGVMRILNLAHGAFYMIGAYMAYTVVIVWMRGSSIAFALALLVSLLSLTLIGAVIERVAIKPLYHRLEEFQLLATFALLLIFDDLVKMIWGPEYKAYTGLVGGSFTIGRFMVPYYFLFVAVLGPIMAILLWLLLSHTMIGKQMRAVAFNQEIAAAMGINSDKILVFSLALSAALAGLAGAIAAPILTAYPGMGVEIIVISFAVLVIGGMGNILGPLVGSLIVGFTRTIMASLYPVLEVALIYIIMAIILLIKPAGIFGREER